MNRFFSLLITLIMLLSLSVHAEVDPLAREWLRTGSKVKVAQQDFSVTRDLTVIRNLTVGGTSTQNGNGAFTQSTSGTVARVTITGAENAEAQLDLKADDGDDADDHARIAMGTDGTLDFRGTAGTNDVVTIDMSTGDITTIGTLQAEQVTSTDDALVSDDLTVSGKVNVVEGDINLATDAVVIESSSNDGKITVRDDSGNIHFLAQGDGVGYYNGGNFGIGTASPSAKLEINAGSTALTQKLTGTGSTYIMVERDQATDAQGYLQAAETQVNIGSLSAHPVAFNVQSVEKMRISSSGNIGIGTNNPAKTFHVQGTGRWIGLPEYNGFTAANAALIPGDLYVNTTNGEYAVSVSY